MPVSWDALVATVQSQPFQATITLCILALTIVGFVREKLPPDVVALLALLSLILTGVLRPQEAFGGFSHSATVSVAAMLVLSAGLERTGALSFLARRVLGRLGRSEVLFAATLMISGAFLSAFINNTAQVAVMIPVVVEICRRTGASVGRLLMPTSHAITLGGMCTVIGTSTNLVAHEYARSAGLPGFDMFELGKVGLPMAAAGIAFLLLFGRWLLPWGPQAGPEAPQRTGEYVSELVVLPRSSWLGKPLRADRLLFDHDVQLVSMVRGGEDVSQLHPRPRYQAGDRLRVRGRLERVLSLASRSGLELHRPVARPPDATATEEAIGAGPEGSAAVAALPEGASPAVTPAAPPAAKAPLPMAELVVLPNSWLIGRTLRSMRFAERYGAVVVALHRPEETVEERPSSTPIRGGDVIVVEGEPDALRRLADSPGFLVIGNPTLPDERVDKVGIAILTLVGVVLLVALELVPVVTAATAGCALLMLTRCLTPREAYQAIDWSIVFLLAGSLALGAALEKTGLAGAFAGFLGGLAFVGPLTVLGGFLIGSMVLSEFLSNSGTVALLAPVAISTARQLGMNPMALLAAVTFGASAAFAMPIGYQTSLMVYGPGGYRFRDFLKVGIPLDLLLLGIGLWLIPRFWPLTPP